MSERCSWPNWDGSKGVKAKALPMSLEVKGKKKREIVESRSGDTDHLSLGTHKTCEALPQKKPPVPRNT